MRSSTQAGFTLLEMLVALVIFGLLMAGLVQTTRFGLTAWSAGLRSSAEPEALAAIDGALRRLIEQAEPVDFTGQPGGLAFTTRLPEGSGLADPLADVSLGVDPARRLVLRWVPHPPGVLLGVPAAPRTELLFSNVAGIEAQYLTPQKKGPPVWSDVWTQGGLPLLVRIKIRFMGGRNWPDLVAAPVGGGNG